VIFVTKFRKKCLNQTALNSLYGSIPRIAKEMGVSVGEIKGEPDHVHFLLETTPTDKLSSLIGVLKCKSTQSLLLSGFKFPFWGKLARTLWSGGGVSIDKLEKYIQNQGAA
jgi:putative transposase